VRGRRRGVEGKSNIKKETDKEIEWKSQTGRYRAGKISRGDIFGKRRDI
jgi:hypothetical protein